VSVAAAIGILSVVSIVGSESLNVSIFASSSGLNSWLMFLVSEVSARKMSASEGKVSVTLLPRRIPCLGKKCAMVPRATITISSRMNVFIGLCMKKQLFSSYGVNVEIISRRSLS